MIPITTLITAGRTGRNTVAFSGRVRGRPLKRGRYNAVFTLVNGTSGTGSPILHFRVITG